MPQFPLEVRLKAMLMKCVNGGKFCCFRQFESYCWDILRGKNMPGIGHGMAVMRPCIRRTTGRAQDICNML